jgi:hypothetical protein
MQCIIPYDTTPTQKPTTQIEKAPIFSQRFVDYALIANPVFKFS